MDFWVKYVGKLSEKQNNLRCSMGTFDQIRIDYTPNYSELLKCFNYGRIFYKYLYAVLVVWNILKTLES